MTKTAYLVIGVESSGTRMLTKALIASGCYGDGGHQQRLDNAQNLNNLPDKIVLRRSIPHAGGVPDVSGWIKKFERNGYTARIVKIYRDQKCNIESMMKRGHAPARSIAVAKFNAGRSLLDKLDGLEIRYRDFVTKPDYRRERFAELGLPAPQMEFYNGDAKWM